MCHCSSSNRLKQPLKHFSDRRVNGKKLGPRPPSPLRIRAALPHSKTLKPPGGRIEPNRLLSCIRPLSQQTPGCLILVTLQFGVDDGARGAADGQLLSGLHLVTEVSQSPVRIHLKLLLQGEDRGFEEVDALTFSLISFSMSFLLLLGLSSNASYT